MHSKPVRNHRIATPLHGANSKSINPPGWDAIIDNSHMRKQFTRKTLVSKIEQRRRMSQMVGFTVLNISGCKGGYCFGERVSLLWQEGNAAPSGRPVVSRSQTAGPPSWQAANNDCACYESFKMPPAVACPMNLFTPGKKGILAPSTWLRLQ